MFKNSFYKENIVKNLHLNGKPYAHGQALQWVVLATNWISL